MTVEIQAYDPIPTIRMFHECLIRRRAIVGPVGSGKSVGATMEVCYYLPHWINENYGISNTRWVIVRNSYRELEDTTKKTVFDWFPDGNLRASDNEYTIRYENGVEVVLWFRACDRPDDMKKFKSMEITGAWMEESIEIRSDIKRMIANRMGRYPSWKNVWVPALRRKYPELATLTPEELHEECKDPKYHFKFGIETTNPPDIEHDLYSDYAWQTHVPGPVPTKDGFLGCVLKLLGKHCSLTKCIKNLGEAVGASKERAIILPGKTEGDESTVEIIKHPDHGNRIKAIHLAVQLHDVLPSQKHEVESVTRILSPAEIEKK